MDPTVGRHVDLHAVAEAPDPFDPASFPDQRIKRGQQRPDRDFAGQSRPSVAEGRLPPVLHDRGEDDPLLDQLRQQRPGLTDREAEVVGQVPSGTDAVGPCRVRQQLLHRLAPSGSGLIQHPSREHPLGQVVAAFEVGATPGRDLAAPEQVLERHLSGAPTPHTCRTFAGSFDLAHRHGPSFGHLSVHRSHQIGPLTCDRRDPAPGTPAVARIVHSPPQQPVHRRPKMGSLMSPVLEEVTRVGHTRHQVARVGSEARQQCEFLGSTHDVDRIDLDHTHPVQHPPTMATIDL